MPRPNVSQHYLEMELGIKGHLSSRNVLQRLTDNCLADTCLPDTCLPDTCLPEDGLTDYGSPANDEAWFSPLWF